ncbi:MAG: hypothetical protein AB7P16_28715 [Bradyrhizobium sp.]|uniref:hypothetical protein n=1 Tax=Bradyrhizobium sp. TaxID=376 RepID=UPI003D0F7BC7
MATIDVKDAAGATVAIEKPPTPGRAAAAASRPVAIATEDFAALGATNETAPASDTAASGLNGRLQRIAQRCTSLLALFTATAFSDANRLPVEQRDGLAVSGSVTSAAVLFTQDMLGYESITVQVTSAGSANITYETSDDNTTWYAIGGLSSISLGATGGASTTNTLGLLQFARKGRYFRARVSTYTSGTVSVVGTLSKAPVAHTVMVNASGAIAVGRAAHDAAVLGAPLRIAGRALTADYAAVASGDVADLKTTLVGALVTKPYAIPELDWGYAAASGGITDTSDVEIKAAAGAGLRNFMTSIDVINTHASVDTEVVVKDGSTVIYRAKFKALGVGARNILFASPLKSTANTALNVACITTGSETYVNARGYVAP